MSETCPCGAPEHLGRCWTAAEQAEQLRTERDALKAEVERLRQDRDEWRASAVDASYRFQSAEAERDQARARVAELEHVLHRTAHRLRALERNVTANYGGGYRANGDNLAVYRHGMGTVCKVVTHEVMPDIDTALTGAKP